MGKDLSEFVNDPIKFLDTVCRNIRHGSSLIDLAETLEVSIADLTEWVKADPLRRAEYASAIEAREEWQKESTLRELRKISTSDIRGLFYEQGGLKPPSEWPREAAHSVASVKVKELLDNNGNHVGEMKEIKFWDKTKALELIGKNQKLFTEKHEHGVDKTLEDLIVGSNRGDHDQSP